MLRPPLRFGLTGNQIETSICATKPEHIQTDQINCIDSKHAIRILRVYKADQSLGNWIRVHTTRESPKDECRAHNSMRQLPDDAPGRLSHPCPGWLARKHTKMGKSDSHAITKLMVYYECSNNYTSSFTHVLSPNQPSPNDSALSPLGAPYPPATLKQDGPFVPPRFNTAWGIMVLRFQTPIAQKRWL